MSLNFDKTVFVVQFIDDTFVMQTSLQLQIWMLLALAHTISSTDAIALQ